MKIQKKKVKEKDPLLLLCDLSLYTKYKLGSDLLFYYFYV